MAISYKEIGKKAETLIEQGKEADRNVQRYQASVNAANSRVVMARQQIEMASRTDEDGNPLGDIESARASLAVAEHQLAYSRQRLEVAQGEARRVTQEKSEHVHEIEEHNQTERSNLQKLRQLRAKAFSTDSEILTDGIAQRINEAEDTRVELMRSMGIDTAADYVSEGNDSSVDYGWSLGGFADLDLRGISKSLHGNGSEGVATNGGISTPLGGGLSGETSGGDSLTTKQSAIPEDVLVNETQDGTQNVAFIPEVPFTDVKKEYYLQLGMGMYDENDDMREVYSSVIEAIWKNDSLSYEQKCEKFDRLYRNCNEEAKRLLKQSEVDATKDEVKRKVLSQEEKRQRGERYIENIMDVYRDILINDCGVVSVSAVDSTLSELRKYYSNELAKDVNGEVNGLYDDPDFNEIISKVDSRRPPIANVFPGERMSFNVADNGHVNPNIGKEYGYSINCQSCVVVFEARERGYDVQVLPNTRGSVLEQLSRDTRMAWIDPKTGKHPDYIFDNSKRTPEEYLDFLNQVVESGNRYTIQFEWKGPGHYGHIVNIDRNENGLLRIKDNQRGINERSQWVGDFGVLDYLSKMKYEEKSLFSNPTPCVPQLLRIDNMDFDFSVVNNIMKGVDNATRRS